MVVAMKEASANGTTLAGLNLHDAPVQRHLLLRMLGQYHDLGETVRTSTLQIPQARQTFSVLGMQPYGRWGFTHGVNEQRVVVGVTSWKSRLPAEPDTLSGTDLVRLTLERSRSAHHAIETLTDLLGRHGLGDPRHDHLFLLLDRDEAYVLEACGRYWALLECRDTRVVTDAAMIRQDWRRLAPGLADFAIQQGWWSDDGSKIDFVRCLGQSTEEMKLAQRRWGRGSVALAQQHGAIDLHFLRRMLAEHYDNNQDLLTTLPEGRLASSFAIDLQRGEQPIMAWVSFGAPRVALHFPICLAGDLPPAWGVGHPESPSLQQCTQELEKLALGTPKDRDRLALALERLQTRFDMDAEEFLLKAHERAPQGNPLSLAPLATEMMHSHVQAFEKEYRRLFDLETKTPQPTYVAEEVFFA